MRGLIAGVFALVCAACGVAQDGLNDDGTSPATQAQAVTTSSAWQPSLPAGTTDVTPVKTIRLRGCEFTVGTAILTPPQPMLDGGISPPPVPPVFLAYVQRGIPGHGPRWCGPGFVVYGASASPGVQVDIAPRPGKPFLALDYTFTVAQGGHSRLGIVKLDIDSGAILCTTVLSAVPSTTRDTGDIFTGQLALDPHGTLTVQGRKDGVIPGETGSGPKYVATYPGFLPSGQCPSAPASVTAF